MLSRRRRSDPRQQQQRQQVPRRQALLQQQRKQIESCDASQTPVFERHSDRFMSPSRSTARQLAELQPTRIEQRLKLAGALLELEEGSHVIRER